MLKEVEKCKNDIKLKQCSIDQLEKDDFSNKLNKQRTTVQIQCRLML